MGSGETINNLKHYLRTSFQFTQGKPDYVRGFRVTLLIALPILYGLYIGRLSMALLFMLAALNVTLVDMGGMTYGKTARIMTITTLLNAFAAIVAHMVGHHIIIASVTTAVWLAAVAMLGLLGNSGVMMAVFNSVIFVLMVSNPGKQFSIESTFIVFVAAGAWAMLLSLIAWPIRPYQPVRKAVAKCFIENAKFMRVIADIYKDDITQVKNYENTLDSIHRSFRNGIDAASEMISNKRKGRFNKSEVEDPLISLLQSVSKDHQRLIAIMVSHKSKNLINLFPKLKKGKDLFLELADIQDEIARLILHSKVSEKTLTTKVDNLINSCKLEGVHQSKQSEEIYSIVEQLLARIKTEIQIAAWQNPSFRMKEVKINSDVLINDGRTPFFTLLKNNLTFRSTCFRHAIRIGITASVSVLITRLLNLPHGIWMPLTVVVIMAPDFGGSFLIRTLQRGSGTILGGLFAILVISQLHNPTLIILSLIILTFIAISIQTINYALFVFFLTPLIVTMYSLTDAGNWHIPVDRILETLGGIALSVIGSQFLFPSWEKYRFPDRISYLLTRTDSYFNKVMSTLTGEEISSQSLISDYRKMELASSNANASLQRTLTQPGLNKDLITPMMSFLSTTNRLTQSVICLHEYIGVVSFKIENEDKLLDAANKISEILQLMSENILLKKNIEPLSNDKFKIAMDEMKNISLKTEAIFGSIPDASLPAIELRQIAEIENNMIKLLGDYFSVGINETSNNYQFQLN